jgi:hypothetical protein
MRDQPDRDNAPTAADRAKPGFDKAVWDRNNMRKVRAQAKRLEAIARLPEAEWINAVMKEVTHVYHAELEPKLNASYRAMLRKVQALAKKGNGDDQT